MAEIEVKGLADFRREVVKLLGKSFTEGLKDEHHKVAQRVVAASHRRAAVTGRRNVVRAADSLVAARTAKGAIVRGGGAKLPWAGAAMFGAEHNQRHTRRTGSYLGFNQFLEPKPGGYVVYPAIDDERHNIERTYLAAIDRLMRPAFPD